MIYANNLVNPNKNSDNTPNTSNITNLQQLKCVWYHAIYAYKVKSRRVL